MVELLRPAGPYLRQSLVATLSILMVATAVYYVVAPSDATVTMVVSESDGTGSAQAISVLDGDGRGAVTVYGSIDASGVPVSDVVVELTSVLEDSDEGATIRVGDETTFREAVDVTPGEYDIVVTMDVGGTVEVVSSRHSLQVGRFYAVSMQVRESGIVTFLPVTSY